MEELSYENGELFGKDKNEVDRLNLLLDAIERYGSGEAIVDIAASLGCSEATLRIAMQNYDLQTYRDARDKASVARRSLKRAGLARICGLGMKRTLKLLENPEVELDVRDLCQIEKTFGDRLAMLDGDATERIEHQGNIGSVIITPPKIEDNGPAETITI